MHARRFLVSLFFLLIFVFEVSAQSIKISGQINGEDGSGLPGVSVILNKNSIGTVSKSDGSFDLTLTKEGTFTISVSSVGYAVSRRNFMQSPEEK